MRPLLVACGVIACCIAAGASPAPPLDVTVALARVEAIAAATPGPEQDEAVATASLALELAGADAIPPLVRRLDERAGTSAAQPLAWALGIAGEPLASGSPTDKGARPSLAPAIEALRRALSAPDWPTRVSAASSLGLLGARDSGADLVTLLLSATTPEEVEAPLLLALAGTGGDAADSVIESALRQGGDLAWGRSMLALHARRGQACWPWLVRALDESPDASVRTTAAAALLLLAEPASACEVGDVFGHEPDPAIRMTLVQALAATASPHANAVLAAIARLDADEQVREAASILASQRLDAAAAADEIRVESARVRDALRALAHGRAFPRDLRDVENGATLVDVPLLEWALRRLPLREDGAWIDDHVRLAQARARILCAAWPDGIPEGRPRVGRR